jgi:2-(1,2-epoxy-1,2-dihydrophenyl)acetyl-CoA isomerase
MMPDPTPTYEFVSVRDLDGVRYLRLDRPEKLNAFAGRMRDDIRTVIEDADTDASVGCLVLQGEGRAFCAGGDVGVMERLREGGDTGDFERILDAANAAALALRRCRTPTVALVHGPAAGGGANLALGCDVRLGSANASFTQSFIHLGLAPDWGGSRVLREVVGPDRARELLLTGRTVRSAEALTLGLLHRVLDDDVALTDEGERVARFLAGRSPLAVEAIRSLLDSQDDFEAQLGLEREWQLRCFDSAEAKAAFADFVARRDRRRAD